MAIRRDILLNTCAAILAVAFFATPVIAQFDLAEPDELTLGSEDETAGSIDNEYGSLDAEPTVLTGMSWLIGDTTVKAVLQFNETPIRYSGYTLERPHRIVLDCFETTVETNLDTTANPPPVLAAELTTQAVEGEVQFARLVLFTERAATYHVEETDSELAITIDWHSQRERQRSETSLKRKRIGLFAGMGVVTATAITIAIIAAASDDEPVPGPGNGGTDPTPIPPPDIPTP